MATFIELNDGFTIDLIDQVNHPDKHLLLFRRNGTLPFELTNMRLSVKDSKHLLMLLGDMATSHTQFLEWLGVTEAVLTYA